MIQFHNLSLAESHGSAAAGSNNGNKTASQTDLASFETALSDAIAATFQQFGIDPKSVNISITPESSKTASTPSASDNTESSATSNSSPVTGADGYDPFLQAALHNTTPAKTSSTSEASTSTAASTAPAANTSTSSSDPTEAFDDNYWASQPSAVQALRYMQPDQRAATARNLAAEGYTIDVPIMVWGWDPAIATSLRQSFGYTWVPSGLQSPIESMPGIAPLPGLTAYDPNHPPAGSIMV